MNTLDQIVAIAAEIAGGDVPVTRESSLEDLQFDSLDCIDFVVAVEDRFDIMTGVADRVEMVTLADVARVVDLRVAERMDIAA